MSEANVEIARRGFEAALRGELEPIAALLAPDVKWHAGDPDAQGACRNRDEALEFMRRARARRGIGELVEIIDAGEKVVVITRRPGNGGPPALIANVTTFREGKVVEMVHYPDPDDACAAAGVPSRSG